MQWSRFSFVNEDFALHAVLGMARSRVFSMPSSSEGGGGRFADESFSACPKARISRRTPSSRGFKPVDRLRPIGVRHSTGFQDEITGMTSRTRDQEGLRHRRCGASMDASHRRGGKHQVSRHCRGDECANRKHWKPRHPPLREIALASGMSRRETK